MSELITVIPVYNRELYLLNTLQSVARQSRRPDRLIVLDNASTDGTCQMVEQFREMPCELIRNEQNLGSVGNLNRALEFAAETEFLHILFSDDTILPDFYARLLPPLAGQFGRGMVFSRYELIDEAGKKLPPWVFMASQVDGGAPREITQRDMLRKLGELKGVIISVTLFKSGRQPSPCRFRTDMINVVYCVFEAEWVAACERIVEVPDTLGQYRLHAGQENKLNSARPLAMAQEDWQAMQIIQSLAVEKPFSKWFRCQKLRLLHSLRAQMFFLSQDLQIRNQLHAQIRRNVGGFYWLLGNLGVRVWRLLRTIVARKRP
jgi:glycosyltransferase involved in cell wall biosynthesis